MFKNIKINYWRQFENVDIDFGSNVTILTGSNGAGKTTILSILSEHFGWSARLLSTPEKEGETGLTRFVTGAWSYLFDNKKADDYWVDIGSIEYSEMDGGKVQVPKEAGSSYSFNILNRVEIKGMHIPSHRPVYSYKEVDSIPTRPKSKEDYFNEYNSNILDKFNNTSNYLENISPSYLLKQSLIGLATFGYGNSHVVPNSEYAALFEGFQDVLKILLPETIGFERLEIRIPEVVLVTKSGDFSIDAASGGVASIIGIAWQIYMFAQNKASYVITIDEPENHLHPSMQRELIPNLIKAFPEAQFIIATHSPFVIGSSKESSVYALTYNDDNRVCSRKLDLIDKSGSATKVLREVLGVPVTIPVWVEQNLNEIIHKYSNKGITEDLFKDMRVEMESKGLAEFMPKAVSVVVEQINDKNI
ncbi:AAA family ATPase [Vibrio tubiashii]|uniref:ATP-dependent OLD family endonuclease n=1 Tax=Vibrio tubiashii ATCC 19109 TaxID=1051646 RepID=F9T3V7_9VIBR|nr:AAA family ATPase [Vibrio tubiashii]AIW17174.1 ATP-dependent OLD family endonuclease [Vibrio tubiashii ATCC 19109]EGU56472.1 ATP-dependent OLD family endonuclease [Vibrio tubiashii ATCC 19109]EIF01325.1 ATP-dependent OLD family endonuclease [Vibrio tubiashii NCIMB 1337 = ATCC 19106]